MLHVFFEICNQISKREFPSDQVVMDAISVSALLQCFYNISAHK